MIIRKQVLTLFFAILLARTALAQQPTPAPPPQQPPPPPAQQQPPARRQSLANLQNPTLADVNTEIGVDKRVIIVMAALNVAGYDYESGNRQLSDVRRQLREDLKDLNPAVVRRLRDYFLAHRQGRSGATAVAPYLSLALSLTEPPGFSIDVPAERLPDDVREITDFALLLEEFYRDAGFSKLLPKYVAAYSKAAVTYPPVAGVALGAVLSYLHTEPVLELPPLFRPRPTAPKKKEKKDKNAKDAQAPEQKADDLAVPNRVRRFIIMPDLLNATGAANLRIVRDDYFLLLGPTSEPNVDAMRRGFLSFVLDPLTERQVKEVAAVRNQLKKLMETRGDKLDKEYAERSAYYLITDSLVRATDARMAVVGLATRRQLKEDEALYELSQAYERGAVLVFSFYDKVKAYESVGVNVKDYFADLLQNIDFEREAQRLGEYEQRLARYKQARLEATMTPAPAATISNADDKLIARINEADQMMRARKYADAKAVLDAARRERPDNARVLFGLADVTSKQAATLNDADQLEVELYAAVEFYKLAAEYASPETEKWLAQRSYVAAAKVLDFIAENQTASGKAEEAAKSAADATAAYELAIKLGQVEGGAYDEAVKAKQQREQRPKQ